MAIHRNDSPRAELSCLMTFIHRQLDHVHNRGCLRQDYTASSDHAFVERGLRATAN